MPEITDEIPEHALTTAELVNALVEQGLLTARQFDERAAGPATGEHPLVWIAEQNWLDAQRPGHRLDLERLTRWLAKWSGLPYWRIDPLAIDAMAMTRLIPQGFADYHQILAIADDGHVITIASAQPYLHNWQLELGRALSKRVNRVIANPEDIRRFIHDFYRLARSVDGAVAQQLRLNESSLPSVSSARNETGRDIAADDAHIVHIVDWLLDYAVQQRASDIHVEPRREQGVIRLRIDGVLHPVYRLPPSLSLAAVSRLKTLAGMNLAERRKPQDGRMKMTIGGGEHELELRLSTLPTAFGEKLVMRLFDPQVLQQSLEQLGFSAHDQQRWSHMAGQPNGIILVTGPTGSGKTTTLYATLRSLATPEVNVCTVEDPIEMLEPAFNQMQVQSGIGLDFASAVRALMRQDPDIIMIGEIRDLETAEMAVQAALTGHLVLSTLHTNSAPAAVTRLLELGIPAYLLRATLLGVMAQRLLRRLCVECKVACQPDSEERHALEGIAEADMPERVFQACGCSECRESGYKGREGIYEIMLFTESLKEQVRMDTELATLRETACREGMTTLRESAMDKVRQGLTTVEEVLRITAQR